MLYVFLKILAWVFGASFSVTTLWKIFSLSKKDWNSVGPPSELKLSMYHYSVLFDFFYL
jgi:hypothetical protein